MAQIKPVLVVVGAGEPARKAKPPHTLFLSEGTTPKNLQVGTFGTNMVYVGDHTLSFDAFSAAVMHVLTATDLQEDDPRLALVRAIGDLSVVSGYDETRTRFAPQT